MLPTKLDRLFRFFQHEDPDRSPGCYWNLAAGALERKARLYRVVYNDGSTQIECEQTIHVRHPEGLSDWYNLIDSLLQRDDIDLEFQRACKELLLQDPWLHLFLTDTLPLPGTDDVSSSSGSTERTVS